MADTVRVALLALCLAVPLAGQDTAMARLRHENDSLRLRVAQLSMAIRQYILAADHYATRARDAEALLSWYRNLPDRCSL